MQAKQIYEFGHFRIDPEERLLLRDGAPVPLTPKAFETLLALVENSGHVVKKDDLMKRVWPDAFVEEANLAQNVSAIRRVLDTNGDQHIETVSKLGYRLIMTTRLVVDVKATRPEGPIETATITTGIEPLAPLPPLGEAKRSRRTAVGFVVAAIVVVGIAVVVWRIATRSAVAAPIQSIVVLPLTNLSGDAN